jgi:hypothetical protein
MKITDEMVNAAYHTWKHKAHPSILSAIRAMLEAAMQSAWVSVDDRMPDEYQDVLIKDDQGEYQTAYLKKNNWVVDWDDDCQAKYRVAYDHRSGKWVMQQTYVTYNPGVTYMSKTTTEKLVDLLNSGIVEF